MNEIIDTLIKRQSCKQYLSNKDVPEDLLKEIVDAGLNAPSGLGLQSSAAIVITNKKTIHELEELNASIMERKGNPFYGAPVVILVIAKGPTGVYDGSAMIMNMLDASYSLGLGSCWIHRAKEEVETDYGRKLLEENGFNPDEYVGVGHVIIGYPANEYKSKAPRKEGRIAFVK